MKIETIEFVVKVKINYLDKKDRKNAVKAAKKAVLSCRLLGSFGCVPTSAKLLEAAKKASVDKNDKMFSRLGKTQKEIINKIVIDDYYIIKTLDTGTMKTTISLVDDFGNHDRDLSAAQLNSLIDRKVLLAKDVSRSLVLERVKFWIDERHAEKAMNACIIKAK